MKIDPNERLTTYPLPREVVAAVPNLESIDNSFCKLADGAVVEACTTIEEKPWPTWVTEAFVPVEVGVIGVVAVDD
jgi:hypothetical protein